MSKICSTILKSQLGFPLLLDSAETSSPREPKIRFTGNSAPWFGSSVASESAQLQIINFTITGAEIQYGAKTASKLQLVPLQDKLSLNAWILDALSQVVKGLHSLLRILVCPSDTTNCIEDNSLLPPAYTPMDHVSGLIHAADISLVCPIDGVNVRVQISLVTHDSVSDWISVTCMPCRAGQARTLAPGDRGWWCASCGPNQYVINPNNPSFGCKVHCLSSFVAKL